MNVTEAVLSRRSVRAFTNRPVSRDVIKNVLDKARWAPSGCNYQPWEALVLTGEPLQGLRARLALAEPDEPMEYRFDAPAALERYKSRLRNLGARMYGSMKVERNDTTAREEFMRKNLVSFDAPVLLLCHFPKLMGAAQWSDVGMWLQTIMILLREQELDSCPQEFMGMYGRTIKAELGLADDVLLFCGLAIGYGDHRQPVNQFERERIPLEEHVQFLGF